MPCFNFFLGVFVDYFYFIDSLPCESPSLFPIAQGHSLQWNGASWTVMALENSLQFE